MQPITRIAALTVLIIEAIGYMVFYCYEMLVRLSLTNFYARIFQIQMHCLIIIYHFIIIYK